MNAQILQALRAIREKPELLVQKPNSDLKEKLKTQTNKKAQGTGNKLTAQEINFAAVLEANGFLFQDKHKPSPSMTGFTYIYQRNGSQQCGDFSVLEINRGTIAREVVIDLKHTLGKNFYLNDGWFLDGVIYLITWNAGTKKTPNLRAHIALGQNIPTEEEKTFMKELQTFKAQKNSSTKKVGSLRPYIRFANQYSCDTFLASEDKQFNSTVAFLNRLSQ
jgi:hypothetical protein